MSTKMNINAKEFTMPSKPYYCNLCDKHFDNEPKLIFHIKNAAHKYKKEIADLQNRIKILEEINIDLEKKVNEGIDALFIYEMKLNGAKLQY